MFVNTGAEVAVILVHSLIVTINPKDPSKHIRSLQIVDLQLKLTLKSPAIMTLLKLSERYNSKFSKLPRKASNSPRQDR